MYCIHIFCVRGWEEHGVIGGEGASDRTTFGIAYYLSNLSTTRDFLGSGRNLICENLVEIALKCRIPSLKHNMIQTKRDISLFILPFTTCSLRILLVLVPVGKPCGLLATSHFLITRSIPKVNRQIIRSKCRMV
jgi:hypothetical protein